MSLAILDPASGALRTLFTATWPEFIDNPPRWSPDGSAIAFDIIHWDPTNTFVDGSLVATVQVAGGPVDRLTMFDSMMAHPDWRPDGLQLVMNSYDLGNIVQTDHPSNVYVMDPEGKGLQQLTHASVDGSMRIATPRWTPDGSRIGVSIATAGADMRVADIQPAFVDRTGGEPVLVSPTLHGVGPDLRPTP
ncbi:MAG: hypothetical protein LH650_07530 [Chloroflexi bacterium]|nr:hypothetical protein [Chloroflexota bacterium]